MRITRGDVDDLHTAKTISFYDTAPAGALILARFDTENAAPAAWIGVPGYTLLATVPSCFGVAGYTPRKGMETRVLEGLKYVRASTKEREKKGERAREECTTQ